ncbi:13_t:CDS:2 [Entrophospora sp. SA101]|nr:13_t:CDS:2 [Entrophospora sp. SA101]CAJ0842916.1 6491_t:CDS:2 [Entrophospora sp. SA101]
MASLFDSNLFEALHHPDYWNRNPNSWGSLSDWDIYYINHTPGSTKMKAHRSLGLELKVLLKRLSKTSYGYYKAIELQKLLKDCHNDPVNIELWQEHSTKLGRLAVENRMNKREILTVGIRAATIAVATEFPKEKTKEEKIQEKFWTVDDFDDNKENDYEPDDADEKIVTTSNTSLCNPTDDDEFTMQDMELFTQRFETMKNEKKWKLKTGKYVEDVLYDLGKKSKFHKRERAMLHIMVLLLCIIADRPKFHSYSSLVHSFIVDPEDKFLQSGFTTDELTEICETMTVQEAPQIEGELLEYIDTFAKTSTKDIREALYASHPRLCRDYNPLVDFAYEHVRTTVTDWVRLLEMHPNPLTQQDLPESWFRINVWRTVDIAFSDTPFVFFVGGEKAGLASTERKNRGRTLNNIHQMQRKKIGKKGDGYVRTFGSRPIEWAASEAGSKWEGEQGTKLIKERGLSLPKTLKDIFISLARKVNFSEEKIRKINVPGFVHSGLHCINCTF